MQTAADFIAVLTKCSKNSEYSKLFFNGRDNPQLPQIFRTAMNLQNSSLNTVKAENFINKYGNQLLWFYNPQPLLKILKIAGYYAFGMYILATHNYKRNKIEEKG